MSGGVLRSWLGISSLRRDRRVLSRKRSMGLEQLEERQLLNATLFDFGTWRSPVADGATGVTRTTYSETRGFGWQSVSGLRAADRGTADPLTRDLHRGRDNTFLVDVPNGSYQVTAILGDPRYRMDRVNIIAEGVQEASGLATSAGQTVESSFRVDVTDGQLNLQFRDTGGRNAYFALAALNVEPLSAFGPTADAGPDQTGQEGQVISFAGSATGTGLSYDWDFGDGTTANGTLTPTKTYANDGTYTVRLTVTDSQGQTSQDTLAVTLSNVAPTADAHGPYSGTAGSPIGFSATATDPSSADTDAGFVYSWDFGDGGTSDQRDASHIYAEAGTYAVHLTVRDQDGGTSSVTTTATATDLADTTAPTVSVTSPADGATVSDTVAVSANASDNVGVVGVQFYLNGAPLGAEDTSAPYSVSWNTAGVANGSHTLTARAWDAAGNQTTAAVVSVTVSNTTPAPSGLVAAFGFNEGSGGTVTDTAGNGLSGTVSGATWTTSGKFGAGLSFDGVNDWVTINDSNLLDLTTGMTLEAWVFPTTTSGTRDVVIREGAGVDIYNLYARNWRGLPESNTFVAGTNRTAEGQALPTNQWAHLAGTYDGSTLRLYVNGALTASTAVSGPIATSSGPLRVGGNSIWGEFFQGLIDEVRVYNRALSAAEVQTDMDTPVGAPLPGDTTPPTLSAVTATSVTATGATISWTTDEPATTQVEYGLTTAYGNTTTLNPALLTAHSQTLNGLAPNTLYHFRVLSVDAAGNRALSNDFTFTTVASTPAPTAFLYVAPNGNDSNPGTEAAPFRTLTRARDHVRTINQNMDGDLTVYLRGGEYVLPDTFVLDQRDSGTNGFQVIWKAYPGEAPVLSGGQRITGWAQEANGVYSAPTGGLEFLQFYVNGERATLARQPDTGTYPTMAWNEGARTLTIDSADAALLRSLSPAQLAQVRITILGKGVNQATLRIASVVGNVVTPQEPERTLIFQQDYPIKEDRPYVLDNARLFLDTPGEFYVDPAADRVYYQPRPGEDLLTSAVTTAPRLEQVLRVEGTLDNPVRNVVFHGLTFQETSWTLPLQEGFIGDQGSFRYVAPLPGDAEYRGPHPGDEITSYPSEGIVAAVHVGYAHELRFERNVFRNTGGSAVNFWIDVDDTAFVGNVIQGAAASGLTVDLNLEGNPTDARKISRNVVIQNNYVTGIGLDYHQAVGIMATYTDGAVIEHNEISEVPYSGISVGFGWADRANAARNNQVRYNEVHNVLNLMADGGGIYTLSRQPGTLIAENYVHDIRRDGLHGSYPIAGIYLDNGSNLITVRDNVGVNVQDSFLFQNGNGPSNVLLNNGGSSPSVIANAGIEPAYRDIIPSLGGRTLPGVPDATAPTVSAMTPTSGATGVNTGANITVTFSEAMDAATIDSSTIELRDGSGSVVAAAVAYDATAWAATLNASAPLSNSATYTVTVLGGSTGSVVMDLAGNALAANYSSSFTTVSLVAAPVANAGPGRSGNEGSAISFSGSATGGEGSLTYAWDYGDGTTGSGTLTPSHTYADNGTYTARLTVTDSLGRSSQDTVVVTVNNVAPSVSAGGPYSATAGAAVVFAPSVTDAPADQAAGFTYSWTFGDGSTSTSRNPSHAYGSAGTYTARLTVTDRDGASASATTTVTITLATPPPAPGNVIVTPHDRIPNFGANPTIFSVQGGNWSDPGTWSLGRQPAAGDIVAIQAGTTVTYDVLSDAALDTIVVNPSGHLVFRTDINTRVTVINFLVLEGGELQIGTEADPVAANVRAEVVIANVPFNATADPEQWGHGLIGLGKVTMHGAVMSDTYARLGAEPRVGQNTLTLAQPVTGWRVGDRLALPDTRHLKEDETWSRYVPQWELGTIQSISADGRTITLSSPLRFDHIGARNGDNVLEFLPHVANLSRNVVVKSQSATGTRGYAVFTHRADVDIRYTSFAGLGRTTEDTSDTSERFPVYFRHLIGPATTPANGYQYTFMGNAVTCPLDPMPFRWGITIQNSHYGLISNNVLYNWAGAGLMTLDGNESFNVIEKNFAMAVRGHSNPRDNNALDGSVFWFSGFNNYVRDNVAANGTTTVQQIVAGVGYKYYIPAGGLNARVPLFKGADLTVSGQYQTVQMRQTPILEFARNEAYGAMATGLTIWHLGTGGYSAEDIGPSVIEDFRTWHVHDEGFFAYPIQNVTFDGFVVRGHTRAHNVVDGGLGWQAGDYWAGNVTIRNADIQGMYYGGVGNSLNTPGVFRIENSYFRNVLGNISISTPATPGSRASIPARRTEIVNTRFDRWTSTSPFRTIDMNYDIHLDHTDVIQRDEVFVYDYNGVAGDDFQLYYVQQAPNFIVPQTTSSLNGAPVAGLTNAQTWAQYGIAIAGAVAPSNATTRTEIDGLLRTF